MTNQTPLERLDDGIARTDYDKNLSTLFRHWPDELENLRTAAIDYRDWAEGRIGELREENRWQPIETAPDDYTTFLAWPDWAGCGIAIVRLNGTGDFYDHSEDLRDDEPEFTHWMPLPKPPEESS